MSRADGVLRVVLTGKWFDMIESGEKREEYRRDKPGKNTWAEKFLSEACYHMQWRHKINPNADQWQKEFVPWHNEDFHPYHTLVASRGYTSRTLTRKIKSIRWGTPRPEWSGDTVTGDCFIIELEDA